MRFVSNVSAFASFVTEKVDAKMRGTGEAMKAEAQARCPKDTWKLHDSIGYIYRQKDKTVQLFADVPYAYFVEFGTRFTRAQPYLRPAINAASRYWGNPNVEMQFGVPAASKTSRAGSNADVVRQNARVNASANKGRAGKARVMIGSRHSR